MVGNIQLSQSIWLHDYCKSATAERFPAVRERQYELTADLIGNAGRLAREIDQPLLDAWGRPIRKTSTYRCADFRKYGVLYRGLNSMVGGSSTSAHMDMRAGDREPLLDNGKEAGEKEYRQFCEMIMHTPTIRFDKMILEFGTEDCPAWIHLQINKDPNAARKQVLRVGSFTQGQYVPFDIDKWQTM